MSEPQVMIEFEAVGKRYRRVGPRGGLKDRVLRWGRRGERGGVSGGRPTLGERGLRGGGAEVTQALEDVSFSLRRGEALGVVGRNGAGKSTLLALAAGVIRPTTGSVTIRGRVSPLLALGAGVHPDLTGRENVELNGVLLGLTRREVRQRFHAIHDFSELGTFIDQPIRHYSSGMLARLAFSVASHLEPEVLIVDEILSVGDASFAAKCDARIAQQRRAGLTMLYVSHDIASVVRLCDRAMYLEAGTVKHQGPPTRVARGYYADQGLAWQEQEEGEQEQEEGGERPST